MPKTCGYICSALAVSSNDASVFVGDAMLSPGVANPAASKVLVPLYQQSLKEYGVPVIGGCPDLVLDTDGLHWGVSSRNAVRKLVDVLVNAALPTANFSKAAPPPLWHWRFDATFRRYYSCCIKCNKLAQDKHLESKDHLRKTAGSLLRRTLLCTWGCVPGWRTFQWRAGDYTILVSRSPLARRERFYASS